MRARSPPPVSARPPDTPDTLKKSKVPTLLLQREENEALAAHVDEAESRLQQALRESAERFLEIRRLTDEKSVLKRHLSDTRTQAATQRLEAKQASCGRLRLSLLLWASWTCGNRRTECIVRRMPCRFHGMLLAQCLLGWCRFTGKRRRKSWYLVESTIVRSITCRLVFDGSIDGRAWKDTVGFRTQLEADISQALSHLSGGLGFLQASSVFKPFTTDHMMARIKVGRIDIKDFSVEVTYCGSDPPPDRLVEEMEFAIKKSSLRGQWTVFATEHHEIARTYVGIARADARKMRLVLKTLWNDAFTSRGRQAAAMKRLYYSSCLLVAGAFRALQQGSWQAKQHEISAGKMSTRRNRQQLAATFHAVRKAVTRTLQKSRIISRIVQRARSSALRAAFLSFSGSVINIKTIRMRISVSAGRCRKIQIHGAFSGWLGTVHEQHTLRKTELYLAENRQMELARLSVEQSNAAAVYRIRLQANRAIVRIMLGHQRMAMTAFKEAVIYAKTVRKVLARAHAAYTRMIFACFTDAVKRSQKVWAACRNVILRSRRLFIACCFQGFSCAVSDARQERSKIAAIITKLCRNKVICSARH